ncbi:MAG: hypothetical protein MJ070_04220 [Lachnospiraceae bacterium]|nr:hypothetical protein [Lachnospiraceae bacterium]
MNTKRFFSLVFVLTLIVSLLCPLSASAADGITVDNCDSIRWGGTHAVTVFTDVKTEGSGSIGWTVPAGGDQFVMQTVFDPIDATGMTVLSFDLYLSDIDAMYGASVFLLEMTSSGKCDVEETSWGPGAFSLTPDGWTHLELNIVGGGCKLDHVNFLRLYALGIQHEEPLTVRLDNIRLLPEGTPDPEEQGNEGLIIGKADPSSAIPTAGNTPGKTVDPAETDTPDTDVPGTDTPDTGKKLSVPGLIVAAFGVITAVIGAVLLKNKKLPAIILLVSGVICLIVGAVLMLLPGNPAGDDPGTKPVTPDASAYFTEIQNGHPELSAAELDVEAALTRTIGFDTKEEYKTRFVAGAAPIGSPEGHPNVVMVNPEENAGAIQTSSGLTVTPFGEVRSMNIKERDCTIFEFIRNQNTNCFYLDVDKDVKKAWAGKTFDLHALVYVTENLKFDVTWKTASGEEKTETFPVASKPTWTEGILALDAPALKGETEGHDFLFTCKGAEYTRIAAMWIEEHVEDTGDKKDDRTGLLEGKFGGRAYVLADANVVNYGAVGDGYTDDTDAFKKAIDAVSKQGGGTVFVPAGFWCITDHLTLPSHVGLVGELDPDNLRASTVICVYADKGSSSGGFFDMGMQSAVKDLAVWYPEQTFVNGQPIPYPATFRQCGSEGVTIENVVMVNSYIGIDFATGGSNNSLQYVRNVRGTCFVYGYENNHSYDIGRIEELDFSPEIWLNSTLPGTPNPALLRTYMLRHSTGMILERIDWTYLADCKFSGLQTGVLCRRTDDGVSNGHMYNFTITDCYYCFRAEACSWMMITNCVMKASGNEGASAICLEKTNGGDVSIADCALVSSGKNAILNQGSGRISVTDSAITSVGGTAFAQVTTHPQTSVNNTISDGGNNLLYDFIDVPTPKITAPDYGKTVVTKPTSDKWINITAEPYNAKKGSDVTGILQKAIDDLKETGGTIYFPAGAYTLNGHINVWAGIELRGADSWAQNQNASRFQTTFGQGDPDGEALFTLYDGAGLRGLAVIYTDQSDTTDLHSHSFTVRGDGKGIYLVDVSLPTSWNGVDFATNRCDEHYIEYLWMCPLNTGIQVGGGSENGIIRDCHFTPNTWCLRDENYWGNIFQTCVMPQSRPYVVGASKNEILYHNFVYGAYEGLSITDGAQNVFTLCHGVDSGNYSMRVKGDCSVTMVDSQLVNLNGRQHNYIITDASFCGKLTMINTAGWGTTANALNLGGTGSVTMKSGIIINAGNPFCRLNQGSLTLIGVINQQRTKDFIISGRADSLTLEGDIFESGLRIDNPEDVPVSGSDLDRY